MIAEIVNRENLDSELEKIGVDRAAFDIFQWKSNMLLIKLYGINGKGANILKQEFLSAGGDVAVHRDVASWKAEKTDCLLIGTERVFKRVTDKLKFEPFFGLKEVRETMEKVLNKTKLPVFEINGKKFDFNERPFIMGILNVTPDSFSDGGKFNSKDRALQHVEEMLKNGADIIDIGGESTRPGADEVPLEEEINRTAPVIEAIRKEFKDAVISIDTYKAGVAKRALESGANIINDISGLRFDEKMPSVTAEYNVPAIVMHIKGTPKNMQKNPHYDNVIKELLEYFDERINTLKKQNVNKIIIDPGIGFGKRIEDNLRIIKHISAFTIFKLPILLGASRKSFIGKVLDRTVSERLTGTLTANAYGILNGANIVRVHDVKEHAEMLKMLEAIRNA
jgi:dihydropteroate synthase